MARLAMRQRAQFIVKQIAVHSPAGRTGFCNSGPELPTGRKRTPRLAVEAQNVLMACAPECNRGWAILLQDELLNSWVHSRKGMGKGGRKRCQERVNKSTSRAGADTRFTVCVSRN